MSNLSCILSVVLFACFIALANSNFAFVSYDEWEGDVSSDWNNANNWEGNSFPSTTQAARIDPDNYTNAPVLSSNSSFTPRYLVVQDNATFSISANLAVGRGMYVGSGADVTQTGGTVSNTGTRDLEIRDAGTTWTISAGSISLGDDLIIDGNGDGAGADPTLTVSGTGSVSCGDDLRFQGNANEEPTLVVSGGTVTIGDDTYRDGADVNINISSGQLEINGNLTMSNADDILSQTNGTLFMDGNNGTIDNDGTINMTGGTITFDENYSLTGTGSFQFPSVNITGSNGDLDQSVSIVSIYGDWTGSGGFTPNSNTIIFNGIADQDITTDEDFDNVTVNKATGSLDLQGDVSIDESLTLTSGIINSDSSNTLTLNDNATANSGNASTYVDNYMIKIGNDDFIFPLGNAGIWSRLEISNATGTATNDVFQASYTRGVHSQAFWDSLSYLGNPGGMYNVSILDYWKLYRTNGSAQPFVKLYWESGDSTQIDNLLDLVVAHYTGSNTWENLGGTTTGTVASGTVETSSRVNSFSPFTFGSSSSTLNPLPITLLSFSATVEGDVVNVLWTTVSELNNDYFEIERSIDGKNFHTIEKVTGAGNSNRRLDYSLIDNEPITNRYSYYRLSQTDYDGSKSYSKIDAVYLSKSEDEIEPIVFPNPVSEGEFFVHYPPFEQKTVRYFIFDQLRKLIIESELQPTDDGLLTIPVPETNGLYILKVVGNNMSLTERIIVK